jgi:MFS family permease
MRKFLIGLAVALFALLCALIVFSHVATGEPLPSLGDLAIVLVTGAFGLAIYFLPTYLAHNYHGHERKNFTAIAVLNFLLGWTVVGWVGALIWALSDEEVDGKSAPVRS